MMSRLVAGLALALGLAASPAQTDRPTWASAPSSPSAAMSSTSTQPRPVSFDYEMHGLPVSHWAIDIDVNGGGRYRELSVEKGSPAAPLQVRVTEATQQRLQGGYAKVRAGVCETDHKHLANMGTKKISYRGAGDDWISCTFNYSEDKSLMEAASTFQAIAQTLQDGALLEHSHRFDRLGLDAEIDDLAKQVGEGQAIEIQNIAPVLQDLVQDERVMDRVRRKSGRLLQDAGLGLGSDRPPLASGTSTDVEPNLM